MGERWRRISKCFLKYKQPSANIALPSLSLFLSLSPVCRLRGYTASTYKQWLIMMGGRWCVNNTTATCTMRKHGERWVFFGHIYHDVKIAYDSLRGMRAKAAQQRRRWGRSVVSPHAVPFLPQYSRCPQRPARRTPVQFCFIAASFSLFSSSLSLFVGVSQCLLFSPSLPLSLFSLSLPLSTLL